MNILLTNDDGYNSIGINLLYKKLKKYGRVIILAPEKPMSAKSVAISIGIPLKLNKISEDIYSLDGTPADCVNFAITNLNIKFDLVISGCNDGFNLSFDTLYSGTIGAALNALTLRVPAIAFSSYKTFDLVDKYFDEVMDYIFKYKLLSTEYILNVNIPNDFVNDIKLASLYYRNDFYYYDYVDGSYFAKRKCQDCFDDQKDSDCYYNSHGVISITPIGKTGFANELLVELNKLVK